MLSYFAYITNFLAGRLCRDDRGATAVEYGMIVALIAAVIVVTVGLLGGQIEIAFNKIYTALNP